MRCASKKIPLGKRIAPISLHFAKGHRGLVLFLAVTLWTYSLKKGNSICLFSVTNIPDKRWYRKRDAYQKSEQAENKFSAYGEQVQKERRTSSKLAEMRIKENSLAQEKKFPWAREIFSLGKRIAPISLHFVKGHRKPVSSLAASLQTHSLKKGKCCCHEVLPL